MTFEGKFIQEEGAWKVTIGIIVFLMKIIFANGNDPIPIQKDGCSTEKKLNQ